MISPLIQTEILGMAYKKLKYWFDRDLAILLSEKIKRSYPQFDDKGFIEEVAEGTLKLELKDRVEFIADGLRTRLPANYAKASDILLQILGPENEKETGMFTEGYWIMPLAKFVEKFGLDHFSISMNAIKEITKRHTGEYCIRPFIKNFPGKTLKVMEKWSCDRNVHIRRLSSEGLRPRLPWAAKLDLFIDDPTPILKIIENLKDDDSRFVQKSVANNLNDILKDNYGIGIKIIKEWSREATPNRKWIIRHALRNQIKKGDAEAKKLLEQLA